MRFAVCFPAARSMTQKHIDETESGKEWVVCEHCHIRKIFRADTDVAEVTLAI